MSISCIYCGIEKGIWVNKRNIRKDGSYCVIYKCNTCKKYFSVNEEKLEDHDLCEPIHSDNNDNLTSNNALFLLKKEAISIIKKELSKNKLISIGELSRETNLSKELVIKLLDEIKENTGLPIVNDSGRIHIEKEMATKSFKSLNIEKLYKNNLKIGMVTDTHFGSKYQQVSLLHSAYEVFEKEGVNFVTHSGDLCDGSPNMHAGFLHELFLHTFEEQVEYTVEHYPKSNLFKTYIRPGNHDNSWIKSNAGDPVRQVCKKREELIYVSPSESSFSHKDSKVLLELFHPAGGMPYSRSYRPQKIFESSIYQILAEYKNDVKQHLPQVLAIGHLHQLNYFCEGGCHVFLLPAFQSQTPYLRSKALNPMVGFIIINFEMDDLGNILEITPKIYDWTSKQIKNDF